MNASCRILSLLLLAASMMFLSCASRQLSGDSRSSTSLQPASAQPGGQTDATDVSAPGTPATGTTCSENVGVLGYLEFRDKMVTIRDGSEGPFYSVAAKDGKVLAQRLSMRQFQAQFPELYEKLKKATAANDARAGSIDSRAVRTIVVRER